jgi:hypothetical protein
LGSAAALFKSDKPVVWEYVSNGMQYVGAGTNPMVKVSLDSPLFAGSKRIPVTDRFAVVRRTGDLIQQTDPVPR